MELTKLKKKKIPGCCFGALPSSACLMSAPRKQSQAKTISLACSAGGAAFSPSFNTVLLLFLYALILSFENLEGISKRQGVDSNFVFILLVCC